MGYDTLIMLGIIGAGIAMVAHNPKSKDAVSPAVKAIWQWSAEKGVDGQLTLGTSTPGTKTDHLEGTVVIDVTETQIQFLRAGPDGTLASAPDLASDFQEWLKAHPELLP